MGTQGIVLPLPPAEILRRLPRRTGTFLLDGGGPESWSSGHAFLGCEPAWVASYHADGRAAMVGAPGVQSASGGGAAKAFGAPGAPYGLSGVGSVSGAPYGPLCFGDVPAPWELLGGAGRGDAIQNRLPASGVVCALAYDLGRWFERLPPSPPDDDDLPLVFLAFHPWLLVYSYRERRYELRSDVLAEDALRERGRWLSEVCARGDDRGAPVSGGRIDSSFTRRQYHAAVERALEYIAAGDVYQVNLSQRFTAALHGSPAALFSRLIRAHPMPFSAYVDGGDWTVVSNSPECFLEREGDQVSTYPIKGTLPRGSTARDDDENAARLAASVKDRAEHVMIVDLERSDLGRVCRPGSVSVRDMARLRSFPSLFHLESRVAGALRCGTTSWDLLRATFPGGSITGAPKIRAMEIIDELETGARRFYTGSIGLVDGDAWMRLNLAIRTATVKDGRVCYPAGGGIVADSTAAGEYAETLLKAGAFFDVLHSGMQWSNCEAPSI